MNATTMNDVEKIYNDLDDEHVKARIVYLGEVAIDGFEDPIAGLFVDAECTKPVDVKILEALALARTFIRHPDGYLDPLLSTWIDDGIIRPELWDGEAYAYDFEADHWALPNLYN